MDSVEGGKVLTGDVLGVVGEIQEVADEEGHGLVLHGGKTQTALGGGAEQNHFFRFEQEVSV